MVDYTFKKVGVEAADLIVELAKEIWLPTFAPYFTDDELNSLFHGMYGEVALEKWFATPNQEMHVAWIEEQPKAYFAFAEKENRFWLDKIYVSPSLQGTGIGKAISQFIEERALDKNYDSISLRVNRRNKPAIDFYLKGGFEIKSSVDFAGPNGFVYDDYIMTKVLK